MIFYPKVMKKIKIGLLPRVLCAIVLGILLGNLLPLPAAQLFATFNAIFSQFLGFMIPLIIVGLVAPAIADIGRGAGKLLLMTVAVAYLDTIVAGILAYGTGSWLFPDMIAAAGNLTAMSKPEDVAPFFSISIPPLLDVMSGLVFAFMSGLAIAYAGLPTMRGMFSDFRRLIEMVIQKVIIPLLPLYIFGIFLSMTHNGQVYHIMTVFAKIILVIFVLHILILIYDFVIAGMMIRRNPFRLLWNMLPAYLTALGTASSAATIPVTLRQSEKNGVDNGVAGFTVPLCATIHMPGSSMKVTACALTICMLEGLPHDFPLFLHFILLLAIIMVAAPGVPGGAIMAALAPLASILGFDTEAQALIIALYIAMDSFGTACNVTSDGAIAIMMHKLLGKPYPRQTETLDTERV